MFCFFSVDIFTLLTNEIFMIKQISSQKVKEVVKCMNRASKAECVFRGDYKLTEDQVCIIASTNPFSSCPWNTEYPIC